MSKLLNRCSVPALIFALILITLLIFSWPLFLIRLVRAEPGRNGQVDSEILNVELQTAIVSSLDFDRNGIVDSHDFRGFVNHFGTQDKDEKYNAKYDINGNETVDFADFLIFAKNYGKVVNHTPTAISAHPVKVLGDKNIVSGQELVKNQQTGAVDGESSVHIEIAIKESGRILTLSDTLKFAFGTAMPDVLVTVSGGTPHYDQMGIANFPRGIRMDDFHYDSTTGKTMMTVVGIPEKVGVFKIEIDVVDGEQYYMSYFHISVEPVTDMDMPPVFPKNSVVLSFTLDPSTLDPSIILEIDPPVRAYDPNDDKLNYSLMGDDASNFTVNWFGHIKTKAGAVFNKEVYTFTIVVDDSNGGVATAEVTINIIHPLTPDKPIFARVKPIGTVFVEITWRAPPANDYVIIGYEIQYRKVDEDYNTIIPVNFTRSDMSYTVVGLGRSTTYEFQVRTVFEGGKSNWSPAIRATTGHNTPPVFTSVSAVTFNENSTGALVTVTASDADADDSITGYEIVDAADGEQFALTEQSGVLTFKAAPNYEDPKDVAVADPSNAASNNEYIVVVEVKSGTGDRALMVRGTLTVTVSDVNEAPGVPDAPTVASSTFNSLTVEWEAPTNTGPEISAYDVRHILSSATDKADDNWVVTEDVWTSVNGGYLEYTIGSLVQNTSYDVQVRAKNDEGTSGWSDTVAGTTEANVAPVFTSVSAVTFSENSTGDVVTVSATDADENDSIIEYGIVEVGDGAQFDLNDQTGVLSFKVAPNYEAPTDVAFEDISNSANNNAGENNEYIVVVEVKSGTDARELMVRDTLTVTVSDVDEAPGVPDAPTVASSTFNSLTVEWEAPTNMGPAISAYDVRHILTSEDETDDTNWAVKEEAWKSGDGNLEYLIGGLSQNTSYDIQVRAESDEGTSDWSSSVSGTTSANVTPVIATISPISVAENSTGALVTVSATDADEGDDIESYGIASGADEELFSIGASTGVLTFKVSPNYEDPKDVAVSDPANDASNNEYIVYVTATGGTGARALTARDTLTITVSDVTEVPGKPATPTIAEVTFNSLIVEWTAPANTGPAISAYDVRYILSSVSATDKEDDSKWTVVEDAWASTNGGNLEYTITDLDQNTSYDVQIRANNDEGMSGWSASVAEMTQQNQAPVFTSASAISVSENSAAAIVTVTAADADTDDEITEYAITGGVDQALFAFDAQTRVLTFTTAPDYERPGDDDTNSEYIVEVTATSGADARELTATQTITVTVTDVGGEAPAVPDAPTVASATFNSLTVEWDAPDNTGPDISAYDIRYILTNASDKKDDKWTVVEEVWTSNNGDDLEYTIGSLEQNTSYDIQVRAKSDEGTSAWSDSVTGTTQANVAPVFTSISAISVSENSTGAFVTVTATDSDSDDNITGYEITGGADEAQFEIISGTGVLSFKTAPNYEAPTDVASTAPVSGAGDNEYIVIVEATSGADARVLTATQTITVTVTDVDTEVPGVPDVPTVVSSTFNSLTVEWNAPENTGPEITAYDVRYILASEDETDDANWIVVEDAWETDGGDLSYTIGSLSPNTSYEVQVRAESDEGISDWSDSVSGTTLVTVPGAPTDLIATSGFLVTLSWIAPADEGGSPITRYEYRASDDDGTTWDPNWTTTGGTATTYTVGDLTFDTEYTFEVRAVNVVGNSLVSNQATATPKRRRPPFSRGVNLTVFMQRPRTHPFITYDRQTFVNIKTLGCDVVRLPFVPLTSGGPSHIIDPLFFTYLDQIVDWAEELGLYIILDNHTNHKLTAEETDQNNRSDTREYLVQVWPQIAERYKNRSKLVLYEVFNEPDIQPSIWNPIQQAVIDTIRAHDNTHTIVVTGGKFHSGALRTLPEYTDDNLIYTFHIYNPGEFTHQGAGWIDRFKDLRGVPWPYDASRMPDPVPEILEDYHTKGTLEKLQNGLKNAVDFAEDRNVPVWCGEFGVYGPYAPPDDRAAWIREARTYMEDNNIAWTLWEYGVGGFKIFENEGDDHFDYNLDISIVEALGLNVPPQLEWVTVSKQAGFEIYTDGLNSLGEGISGKLYSRGWLTFDDDTEAVVGNKSIYWSGAKKGDIVRFDFTPNFDLSLLADDYVFEFWVWGDTPGTEFRVRFDMDSNRGYRVNEENIGITSWDSQWHQVSIPLSRLGRSNATWEDVDGIIFTTTEDFGDTIFRLDDIKISSNVAPVIAPISPITVAENSTSDLVTVSATDDDMGDDIERYGIESGADGAQFSIGASTGVLTFKVAPNYEAPADVAVTDPANAAGNNEYIVFVSATSGTGGRALTARDTLTVTLTDVDGEAPGVPDAPTVAYSTFNSLTVEWEAPTNTGPAISAYDVRHILTSEDETDDANWTVAEDAWESGDGALEYTISSLSQDTSYDVQVRAENDEGTSGWSDTVVGMTEIAPGICARTQAVQNEILSAITGVTDCADVTNTHLTNISGTIDLSNGSITTLQENDFSGLFGLQTLNLDRNQLSALPANVFSDLTNLQRLELDRNQLSALSDNVFSGLTSLQVLRLERNQLSQLPDRVFADLSNLRTLNLKNNTLSTLPDSLFYGLSNLGNLDVSNNTGAPFTLTLELKRIDNADLTAQGPATVVVSIAQGAPFDMTVELSATDGTLTDGDGNAITEVTISKGNIQSEPITVTQSGTTSTTVSLGTAPSLPANYVGIQTAVGTSLVLFGE